MSKLFYAVCENNGVCGVKSNTYKSLKAVFSEKNDAELLVENSNEMNLIVTPVYLKDARQ